MQRLETYIDFNAEETALLPSPLISGMCASPHVSGALASGELPPELAETHGKDRVSSRTFFVHCPRAKNTKPSFLTT